MDGLETGRRCPAEGTISNDALGRRLSVCLTKDLRYESNDSREMEKGSFSLSMLLWLEDIVDVGDFCQKPFFSVGEGYGIDQRHCTNIVAHNSWTMLTGR